MKYIVESMWMMVGTSAVEADSPAEARQKVLDTGGLPADREYLADSFRVMEVNLEQ